MAHYDRAIPAGGEGKISIYLSLRGTRGEVKKSTIVLTNDPKKEWFTLIMRGWVVDK